MWAAMAVAPVGQVVRLARSVPCRGNLTDLSKETPPGRKTCAQRAAFAEFMTPRDADESFRKSDLPDRTVLSGCADDP
jgi:hypothetical protein